MVGLVLGLNILQEWWGKESAQKTIYYSFGLLVTYTLFSQLHLSYTPALTDTHTVFYQGLLEHMPRLTAASLTSYVISLFCDRALYSFLRTKYIWSVSQATTLSIIASQSIDTFLFSFLGLYGTLANISSIILVSLTIKGLAIAIMTPYTKIFSALKKPRQR
jgi:hypothetical protein